jgi:hypothetical protein
MVFKKFCEFELVCFSAKFSKIDESIFSGFVKKRIILSQTQQACLVKILLLIMVNSCSLSGYFAQGVHSCFQITVMKQ